MGTRGERVLVPRAFLDVVTKGVNARVIPRTCHRDTGALLDHTTSTSYRPTERVAALVRQRDGRCRFPGCQVNARFCDLDHVRPWPTGPTAARNLICLCRRHHRDETTPRVARAAPPRRHPHLDRPHPANPNHAPRERPGDPRPGARQGLTLRTNPAEPATNDASTHSDSTADHGGLALHRRVQRDRVHPRTRPRRPHPGRPRAPSRAAPRPTSRHCRPRQPVTHRPPRHTRPGLRQDTLRAGEGLGTLLVPPHRPPPTTPRPRPRR